MTKNIVLTNTRNPNKDMLALRYLATTFISVDGLSPPRERLPLERTGH